MVRTGKPDKSVTGFELPPGTLASVTPGDLPPDYEHRFTLQLIMELQKTVAELAVKSGRLIDDVKSQSEKIDVIRHNVSFVKGAIWAFGAFGVVFSILGALFAYYMNGQISILLHPKS